MRIAIYGVGYVGLVTAVCLAELGHQIFCVDVDATKIEQLQQGHVSIYEQGLPELLIKNLQKQRIQFSIDAVQAIAFGQIQMIAVGTPPLPNGAANLLFVNQVAKTIATHLDEYKLIVTKSTVPVGTALQVQNIIQQVLTDRNKIIPFDVASNPEFLREGCAVYDCLHPDRILVGVENEKSLNLLQQLYQPLMDAGYPLISMSIRSAELTKYAANAYLATKISFMNEISQLAERTGADIEEIRRGMSMDSRINEQFLQAGCGFGGSCFPKDVAALNYLAIKSDYQANLLRAVINTNKQQQALLFIKIRQYFHQDLTNKTIAMWGLAFKPNTDDVRCASSCVVMELLWRAGATVKVYDPKAMAAIAALYPDHPQLIFCDNAIAALDNADALAVITEWQEFMQPDFTEIKNRLRQPVIFDGRNIYDPESMQAMGFDYFGIGRGQDSHRVKARQTPELATILE